MKVLNNRIIVQINETKYKLIIKYIFHDWMTKLWNNGIVLINGANIKGNRDNKVVPNVSITLIFDFERIRPDDNPDCNNIKHDLATVMLNGSYAYEK